MAMHTTNQQRRYINHQQILMQKKPKQLITTKQIAEKLGKSVAAIYQLCKKDKMPHYRVGALYRFDECESVKWFKEHLLNASNQQAATSCK
jgi:excisionase family DNA binding protein